MPGSVLLIGLNEKEPLTILDGNHRFVAAILEGKVDRLRFLCGLSPKMTRCCWYKTNFFTLARYAINLLSHLLFYSRSARNDFSNVPGTSRADIIPNEAAEAWWLQQAPRSEGQQLYETQNAYRESA